MFKAGEWEFKIKEIEEPSIGCLHETGSHTNLRNSVCCVSRQTPISQNSLISNVIDLDWVVAAICLSSSFSILTSPSKLDVVSNFPDKLD